MYYNHCVKVQVSGPYFLVFGPEKSPYSATFHAVERLTHSILLAHSSSILYFYNPRNIRKPKFF